MHPCLRLPAVALGLALAFAWAAPASAETLEEPKERSKDAEVTGTVVAYTKRSLSLEFHRSKSAIQEMLLPVDPAVTAFERLTGITDLQRGDQVKVGYRQTYRKNDSGEWTLKTVVATKISKLGTSLGSPRLKSETGGGDP